jgi:hypothetical protein
MSPLYRGGRRQGATRSAGYPPWYGKVVYRCSGRGSHTPVTNLERPAPGILRCPLCALSKPVNYKRRKLIATAGLTEVDISALPF